MYQQILVPVDGSPTSERGLDEAIRLARLTGGRLRLMHVVDELSLALANSGGLSMASPDMFQLLRDGGHEILAQAKARVEAASLPVDTLLDDTLGGRVADFTAIQESIEVLAEMLKCGFEFEHYHPNVRERLLQRTLARLAPEEACILTEVCQLV